MVCKFQLFWGRKWNKLEPKKCNTTFNPIQPLSCTTFRWVLQALAVQWLRAVGSWEDFVEVRNFLNKLEPWKPRQYCMTSNTLYSRPLQYWDASVFTANYDTHGIGKKVLFFINKCSVLKTCHSGQQETYFQTPPFFKKKKGSNQSSNHSVTTNRLTCLMKS